MKYSGSISKKLEAQLENYTTSIANSPDDAKLYIQRGMVKFKMGEIYGSITDFDTAQRIDSTITPHLWQRGLSYYYIDKFTEAAKQFEASLTVDSQNIEKTIWRYLCIAQTSGMEEARRCFRPAKNDSRKVMQYIQELYSGNCSIKDVLGVGNPFNKSAKFYAHLYIGLYFEVTNEMDKAQDYIVKAADKYKIDDYMWYLGFVHKNLRNWN